MSSKLNMQDIVNLLVANGEITKEEAEQFLSQFFNVIDKGLSSDEMVKVKDFGTFKLTQIEERESIDVNTQEKILIPSHRRVSFVPASMLKELVNKPFAHFETTPLNDGILMDGIPQDISVDEEDRDSGDDDEEKANEGEQFKEQTASITESIVSATEELSDDKKEQEQLSTPLATFDSPSEDAAKEETTAKEDQIKDDKKETIEEKLTQEKLKKSSAHKSKTKSKSRRHIMRRNGAVALLLVIIVVAFSYYSTKKSSKSLTEESRNSKATKEGAIAKTETLSDETPAVVDSVEVVDSSPRKIAKMSPGRTLRLIALDKLGDKEFWIYIYMINKGKIKNPNVVPIGLELELPRKSDYPMDATNPDDVAKAKKLGDEVIKKF